MRASAFCDSNRLEREALLRRHVHGLLQGEGERTLGGGGEPQEQGQHAEYALRLHHLRSLFIFFIRYCTPFGLATPRMW